MNEIQGVQQVLYSDKNDEIEEMIVKVQYDHLDVQENKNEFDRIQDTRWKCEM